jgi:lauroyl/myristoyl acyltransferase
MSSESLTGAAGAPDLIDRRVSGVRLPVRIYATPSFHRALPARAAFGIAALRARVRERRNPRELESARAMFETLLEHTPRAHEAEEIARRWMAEKSIVAELFWRPWLSRDAEVTGAENWHDAKSRGRGVILAYGHIMPTFAMFPALAARGMLFHSVIGPHYWAAKPPGYPGLEILRWLAYAEDSFGTASLVRADRGSGSRILELLAANEVVNIAFDVPGSTPTRFLGRTVGLAPGPPRLAETSGAVILPVINSRAGTKVSVALQEPIDPLEIDDPQALRHALTTIFERHLVARPETVQLAWDPLPLIVEQPGETPNHEPDMG